MPRDARLDLDRYFGNEFNRRTKLNFNDLFDSSPGGGQFPWEPSRFNSEKLLNYAEARKRNLNKRLNSIDPADPQAFELFTGLGRFNKENFYDFNDGRAVTKKRPEEQIDFNKNWIELYRLSPTIKPGDRAKNPMPSASNPDPNGYLMASVQDRIKNEEEGSISISDLVGNSSEPPTKKEEAQGQKEMNIANEEENTEKLNKAKPE